MKSFTAVIIASALLSCCAPVLAGTRHHGQVGIWVSHRQHWRGKHGATLTVIARFRADNGGEFSILLPGRNTDDYVRPGALISCEPSQSVEITAKNAMVDCATLSVDLGSRPLPYQIDPITIKQIRIDRRAPKPDRPPRDLFERGVAVPTGSATYEYTFKVTVP